MSASASIEPSEKSIQNSILSYLKMRRIFVWQNNSTGIYDQKQGRYRRQMGIHRIVGVSDILGIYKGVPLAIEVKSKKGKLSPAQVVFIDQFRQEGGIAFVARSIDDVAENLGLNI